MATSRLYSADSIGKSFGTRTVLKAASIWGSRGSVTALLGRNGSGKSTLLRIGAGVLAADHGVVLFDGGTYLRPRLSRLARRGLFYLPDRGLLSRRFTVRQHLDAVERAFGHGRTAAVVERLHLDASLDALPDELSGGERRRVEVALAVARSPTCLLADEPFGGIGPTDVEVLTVALKDLARTGCALIVSGHEVPALMAIADEVVWMVAGTTHGVGAPDQAKRHEQFRREYLGPAGA